MNDPYYAQQVIARTKITSLISSKDRKLQILRQTNKQKS